jgi:hypothetical protein
MLALSLAIEVNSSFIQLAAVRTTGWTLAAGNRYGAPMARRSTHDPLATVPHPTWLVVQDMFRNPLEVTQLVPGADLRAAMSESAAMHTADGWQIEGELWYGSYFCNREGVRQFVFVTAVDPSQQPSRGHGCVAGDSKHIRV